MLAQKHRFHGHGSLRYVYKNGDVARSHLFIIKATRNKHRQHSRVSIVVSKKVFKHAVRRNIARRRVYEIIRKRLPFFASVADIAIIVVSSDIIHIPHRELEEAIDRALLEVRVTTTDETLVK